MLCGSDLDPEDQISQLHPVPQPCCVGGAAKSFLVIGPLRGGGEARKIVTYLFMVIAMKR